MGKLRVGWVGDYKRVGKRFDLAYRVANQLDAELVVAGPLGTETYVEHEEMPEFYRDVDCLLVTSEFEAHPLIVYEALACGCPALIERNVGDCYVNQVKGVFYYEGFDIDNIAKSVKAVVDNRDAMVEAGVRCIRDEWGWGKFKSQYEQMFRDVSGIDFPKVMYLIDQEGWSWGFMAEEIKKHVWRHLEVLAVNTLTSDQVSRIDFANSDLIVNNVWSYFNKRTAPKLPVGKQVMAVNNPAFLNPQHAESFYKAITECRALTTVSIPIAKILHFMGLPVYYATRGIDTKLFHP